MGLLLSILVFSVGVLEAIACARHVQYGYLPEWAPRRHVVAGTSGLAKLREHWRKKPSGSVECDSKSNQSSDDASRQCETECSLTLRDECCGYTPNLNEYERTLPSDTGDNFNSCGRGHSGAFKCYEGISVQESDAQRIDNVSEPSSSPTLDSTANVYNGKTETHKDILLPGIHLSSTAVHNNVNHSSKTHEDVQDVPYEKVPFSEASADISQEVDRNTEGKMKPRPLIIHNVNVEHESTDEHKFSSDTLTPHSRSTSPTSSPKRSKADISWPLFASHFPISRRPSTPTTAEELSYAGDVSPYFGGEMLTSDHVRSTQRPLAVSTDTYHADQDICPVIVRENILAEDIKSVYRPLMISARIDDGTPPLSEGDDNSDGQAAAVVPCTRNAEISTEHTPPPVHIQDDKDEHSTASPLLQAPPNEGSIDDGVMAPVEETYVREAYIHRKRRSSKTEYLPHDERVVEVVRNEVTAEPSFAVQKEAPNLIKSAKAASFEEARLECFKTKPIIVENVAARHDDARRTSLLTDIEKLDILGLSITDKTDTVNSTAIVGRIESKPTKDTKTFPSNSKGDASTSDETRRNQSIMGISGVVDDTPETKRITNTSESQVMLTESKSQLDREQCEKAPVENTSSIKVIVPSLKITADVFDRKPLVEVTATSLVDEIINDAILRLGKLELGEPTRGKEFVGHSLITEKGVSQEEKIKQWLQKSAAQQTSSDESSTTIEVDGDILTVTKDQPAERDTTNISDSNNNSQQPIPKELCHDKQNFVQLSTVLTNETPTTDATSMLTTTTNECSTKFECSTATVQKASTPDKESITTTLLPLSEKTVSTSEETELNVASLPRAAANENIIPMEKKELEEETSEEFNEAECREEKKPVESKSTPAADRTGPQPSVSNAECNYEISSKQSFSEADASNSKGSHSEEKLILAETQNTELQKTDVPSNINLDRTKSTSETPLSLSEASTLEQQQNNISQNARTENLPPKQNNATKDSVSHGSNGISNSHTIQKAESIKETSDTTDASKHSKEDEAQSSIPTTVKETKTPKNTTCVRTDDGSKRPQDDEASSSSSHSQQKPSAPDSFWLIFSGEYTKAMSKDWHSGHFCCWQCDESLTGQRYVLRDDHPYCIKCYESVFANMCEECNKTIGIDSKDLSYKDKHWHEACFLCTKCRVSLVDKQFGSKADKIYCGNCYDAQFASRCDGCGEIFRAGTKKMEYKTRQWHEKCFCCCVCKSAIGTKSFIPREQEIYCATCYEEKFATRCVKCNKIITSGGVTYKNEPWHRECFTCTNCNTSLAGQRFTSRDEKPYCAECFGELFAKRCTACSKPITGIGGTRFISFEDRHWHNDCFICASCKTSLVGRGFITDADDIICPECAKQKLSA